MQPSMKAFEVDTTEVICGSGFENVQTTGLSLGGYYDTGAQTTKPTTSIWGNSGNGGSSSGNGNSGYTGIFGE